MGIDFNMDSKLTKELNKQFYNRDLNATEAYWFKFGVMAITNYIKVFGKDLNRFDITDIISKNDLSLDCCKALTDGVDWVYKYSTGEDRENILDTAMLSLIESLPVSDRTVRVNSNTVKGNTVILKYQIRVNGTWSEEKEYFYEKKS